MSGRAKTVLYAIVSAALLCAALAGAFCMWYFGGRELSFDFGFFVLGFLLLPLQILIHEAGHLLVGSILGMRFVAMRIGHLVFRRERGKLQMKLSFGGEAAGQSVFYPRHPRAMRSRYVATALGGIAFNFLYAIVFFLLYFLLPPHAGLLFFELFAPLCLAEGLSALYPVELSAGKSDGRTVLGVMRRENEERVVLRVLTAQGILCRKTFASVPESLLFDSPVVREDLPALHALLLLRVQYLLSFGREEETRVVLSRLKAAEEYLSEEAKEEVLRYEGYFTGEFVPSDFEPLEGVRVLESKLAYLAKKNLPEAD